MFALKVLWTFIKTYKQAIFVLALVASAWFSVTWYGDKKFEEGKYYADAAWIKKYDESVKKKNDELDQLSKYIQTETKTHKQKLKDTEDRLNSIIEDYKSQLAKVKQPKTDALSTCTDTGGSKFKLYDEATGLPVIDLGPTFKEAWNKITTESKMD